MNRSQRHGRVKRAKGPEQDHTGVGLQQPHLQRLEQQQTPRANIGLTRREHSHLIAELALPLSRDADVPLILWMLMKTNLKLIPTMQFSVEIKRNIRAERQQGI